MRLCTVMTLTGEEGLGFRGWRKWFRALAAVTGFCCRFVPGLGLLCEWSFEVPPERYIVIGHSHVLCAACTTACCVVCASCMSKLRSCAQP